MRLLTSIAFSGFVAVSTFFGGAAQAFSGPWTDCAFVRPNQSVKSVNCRVSQTRNGLIQVDWADGVSDTFQVLQAGSIRDSRGGHWVVKKEYYEGKEMMVFESMQSRTVFVIAEW